MDFRGSFWPAAYNTPRKISLATPLTNSFWSQACQHVLGRTFRARRVEPVQCSVTYSRSLQITANYSNDSSVRTQITYSIGYLFMRRPHAASGGASGTSQAGVGGDERAKQSAAAGGAAKDETTPLLGDSEDEDASSSASEANNEETR